MARAAAAAAMAVFALPAALILFFAGPITLRENVPLARPSQVKWYKDAAEEVGKSTKTRCAKALEIDWKALVAIDGVRLEQEFESTSKERAGELARLFVEQDGAEKCRVPVEPPPQDPSAPSTMEVTEPRWKLVSVERVIAKLGFDDQQRAWARRLLAFDLASLADVGVACVGPNWRPAPRPGWTWPVPGVFAVSSCYGPRIDPVEFLDGFHTGLDVAAAPGTPLVAAIAGTVTIAGPLGECGLAVEIRHEKGHAVRYCHMATVTVERADVVSEGVVVGSVGNSGKSTGPHLHPVAFRGGQHTDPIRFFQ